MSEEQRSLKDIINFRMQKLEKLRESGLDPYPHNFTPTNKSVELTQNFNEFCLLYTSPSPRDVEESRMPSSA